MAAEAWGDARTAGIAESLARVRKRIQQAATDAGRDPAELTLIAVTKTFPVDDARRLVALGIPDLGEARDQEARAKARELPAEPWAIGVGAFLFLVVLLVVTLSFGKDR